MNSLIKDGIASMVLFLIFFSCFFSIVSGQDVFIDPVPYAKLLNDVLSYIVSDNYDKAHDLITTGLTIYISIDNLRYVHEKLYKQLLKLNHLLNQTMRLEQAIYSMNVIEAKEHIRKIYNELYILKDAINSLINDYISVLTRYVHDKSALYLYQHDIMTKTELLISKIDNMLEYLEKTYKMLEHRVSMGWIEINVLYPDKIYGGDEIWLNITLLPHFNSTTASLSRINSSVSITLIIGGVIRKEYHSYTVIPTKLSYRIKVPGIQELLEEGIEILRKKYHMYSADLVIVVKAESSYEEYMIKGYKVINTNIFFVKPKIIFKTPSIIYLNQSLTINVDSEVEVPLNVSIYIDKVSPDNLIENVTIYPGANIIKINNSLPLGYHTIIILTSPYREYVGSKWSAAIAITQPSISVTLNIPSAVIGLSQSFSITGHLREDCSYIVIVKVDNVKIYEKSFHEKNFSIVVDPPFSALSLIIWFRKVDVEIIPINTTTNYSSVFFSFNVLFINPLFTVSLLVLAGLIYMHPLVSSTVSWVFHSIRRVSTRKRKAMEHGYLYVRFREKSYVYIRPKPFKTRKYYRSILSLLSKIVGFPKESETLREYVSRIKTHLPESTYRVLYQLFILFEQDLYSIRDVSIDTVKRLYKILLRRVRK